MVRHRASRIGLGGTAQSLVRWYRWRLGALRV